MSAIPFAQLSAPPSEAAVLADVLSGLQFYGYPVTSWQSGSVGRTIAQVDARAITALGEQIAFISRSSFIQTAAGDWLDAIASQFYAESRDQGELTRGIITLSDSAGTGPHVIAANDLWVSVGTSGLRYNNTTPAVIPLGGSASVSVQAESIGAQYNVANGAITVLGTAGFPGVTVSNPAIASAGGFSAVGTAASSASLYFEIIAGATVLSGAATYRVSLDAGATFGAVQVLPASGLVVINGVSFTFAGQLSGGDVAIATLVSGQVAGGVSYLSSLTTSNTWITTAGRDVENDDALRMRCIDKWGSVSAGATESAYRYWSRKASPQVTRVSVRENVPATGIVTITLGGASGGVSAATVAAVRSYIEPRRPLTTFVVVLSATTVTINVSGTVYVTSAQLSNAQSEVAAAFASLTAELDMGATVYRSELIQRVMDGVGVQNFVLSSPIGDIVLTPSQIADFNIAGLVWVVV